MNQHDFPLRTRIGDWNSICKAHRNELGQTWIDTEEVISIQSVGIQMLSDEASVGVGLNEVQRMAMAFASTHALSTAIGTYSLLLRGHADTAHYLRRALYDLRAVGPAIAQDAEFAQTVLTDTTRKENLGVTARKIMSDFGGFTDSAEYKRFQDAAHMSATNFAFLLRDQGDGSFVDPDTNEVTMFLGAGVRNRPFAHAMWLETLVDHSLITFTLSRFLGRSIEEDRYERLLDIARDATDRFGEIAENRRAARNGTSS